MTRLMDVCSAENKSKLSDKFTSLKYVCLPSYEILSPSFKFKKKEAFSQTDVLFYGSGEMRIEPDRIREYSYQDRQTLRDSRVDFIKAGKVKWFYNIWELQGNFFSEDGQKKVHVDFNFWMDAEKIWSIPGIKQAMRSVLKACEGDTFPTNEEAKKFFTDEVCQKIYQRQPSINSIKQAVLELIEPFRKTLVPELVHSHSQAIIQSSQFQKFLKENPQTQSKPIQNQVLEYLKKNKNAIYIFGEKFGLIKGAAKAIRYQEIRDSVRHPKEVKAFLSNPKKVYEDFCTILMIPKKTDRFYSLGNIVENLETADNLEYMSDILDILSIYEDKSLKKGKQAYWQDLVQKGILTIKEVSYLQEKIKECNDVAHINPDSEKSKSKVRDDTQLLTLSIDLLERHEEKKAQKNAQIKKWIKESSHI